MSIEISHISKTFPNGFRAVREVSFKLEAGCLAALLGPSGSGKSTLLRIIAGLETPDPGGEIRLTGEDSAKLSARERNVGFVFQHYALFKHMTVRENVAFGLRMRHVDPSRIAQRVGDLIRLVQLEGLEDRYPSQLSGGQRQRVAVARALAPEPRVLLLDEPFGALDAKVREELREWIVRLHEESHVTTLFVTHDQHEALEISTQVLVMNNGRIEQEGTPLQIFDHPTTPFVAEFVGQSNFVEAAVSEKDVVVWGPFKFALPDYPLGRKVRIYFRPNDVYVSSLPETHQVKALIERMRFQGPMMELELNLGEGRRIVAHVPKGVCLSSGFAEGRSVYAGITAFYAFWVGEDGQGEKVYSSRPPNAPYEYEKWYGAGI